MLIQGPKQPGNDLNVYHPLFEDELDTLWLLRAHVWDADQEEHFSIKTLLLTTVNDYSAYTNPNRLSKGTRDVLSTKTSRVVFACND